MVRATALLIGFGCLLALTVEDLAGARGQEIPASTSEFAAVERFLAGIEKPPVAYKAKRRLDASAAKLKESAWMEAITEFDPLAGFTYTIVAQGGSERIQRRVLKAVLEAERENTTDAEWRKANLSRANYEFDFGGRAADGMLRMQLTPKRRDPRLVLGSALVTATSGNLVRVDGRLSKSPSIWVRWVDVSRSYAPIAGAMMPVAIESTADVRIAGMSTFSMTYDYNMVDGQAVNDSPSLLASR
jgi:hypothetical protein